MCTHLNTHTLEKRKKNKNKQARRRVTGEETPRVSLWSPHTCAHTCMHTCKHTRTCVHKHSIHSHSIHKHKNKTERQECSFSNTITIQFFIAVTVWEWHKFTSHCTQFKCFLGFCIHLLCSHSVQGTDTRVFKQKMLDRGNCVPKGIRLEEQKSSTPQSAFLSTVMLPTGWAHRAGSTAGDCWSRCCQICSTLKEQMVCDETWDPASILWSLPEMSCFPFPPKRSLLRLLLTEDEEYRTPSTLASSTPGNGVC